MTHLTDEQIADLYCSDPFVFARAIEAAVLAANPGVPREPVAWLDPEYKVGYVYGKRTSPVTTYPRRDWIPLYADQPAVADAAIKGATGAGVTATSAAATPSPAVADVLERLETWTGTGDADTADFLHDVRDAAALIREQETWILSLLNGDDLAMERERAERAEAKLAAVRAVVDRLIGFHDRREDAALCAVIEEARAILNNYGHQTKC